MTTTARYELRMMLRKRSAWITMAVVVVLLGLMSAGLLGGILRDPDAREVMSGAALLVNLFLPVAYGCLLADRWIRDRKLGVAPILDTTPVPPMTRLFGKYVGVCVAAAVPVAAVYFGFAAVYAVVSGRYAGLVWALAIFGTVLLPAVLFVGAFALAVPLVLPAPLFRVLFVGYWFWGNAIHPTAMPTPAQGLVSPIGDYPLQAFFRFSGEDGSPAGPEPGASLNFLRPEVTPVTAWLSIGLLLTIAALVLYATETLRARAAR